MHIPRIFEPHPLAPHTEYTLSPEASHHVITVLRLKPGEPLCLFNGTGGEYEAVLHAVQRKQVIIQIHTFHPHDPEAPLQIHLGQGLARNERMDWILQKAVELGVHTITPLFTEKSVIRARGEERIAHRMHHWQQIIINATEQCGRTRLTVLNEPVPLHEWYTHPLPSPRFLLEPTLPTETLSGIPTQLTLLVGPEAGFSHTEIEHARQHGFQGWQLGPRILRTETAGLAAIAIAHSYWGDLRMIDRDHTTH